MWKFLCGLLWCAALLGVVKADGDPRITIRLGVVDSGKYVLKDDRDLTCEKKPGSTAKSQTFNYVVTLANKGEVNLNNFANPGVECVWEYNRCKDHSAGSVAFRGWTTKTKYGKLKVRGEKTPKTVFVTLYTRSSGERLVVTDAEVGGIAAFIKNHIPFAINSPTNPGQQTVRLAARDAARQKLSVFVKGGVGEEEVMKEVPCNTFISRPKGAVPLVGDYSVASLAGADQSSYLHVAKDYKHAQLDEVEFVLASDDDGELYCLKGNRWADRIQTKDHRELLGGVSRNSPAVNVLTGAGLKMVDDKTFENLIKNQGESEKVGQSKLPANTNVNAQFDSQLVERQPVRYEE